MKRKTSRLCFTNLNLLWTLSSNWNGNLQTMPNISQLWSKTKSASNLVSSSRPKQLLSPSYSSIKSHPCFPQQLRRLRRKSRHTTWTRTGNNTKVIEILISFELFKVDLILIDHFVELWVTAYKLLVDEYHRDFIVCIFSLECWKEFHVLVLLYIEIVEIYFCFC